MDIILYTGFEKITHSIIFQPSFQPKSVLKGKALIESDHVREVRETRNNQLSTCKITAKVARQCTTNDPRPNKKPYDVTLYVSS